MIKPGYSLCHSCGRTSRGFYYRDNHGGAVASLVYRDGSYMLEAANQSFQIEPRNWEREAFPPEQLRARVGTAENYTTMIRCCPHCGEKVLSKHVGRVPIFVFAVIGATGSGKSSWMAALGTAALGPMKRVPYRFYVRPVLSTADEGSIGATVVGKTKGSDYSNYIEIVRRTTNEVVAMAYVLDFAGELYENAAAHGDSPVARILSGESGEGFERIDAAVVIEPAVPDALNNDMKNNEEVLRTLDAYPVLRKVPVAHILTFGDLLIQQEQSKASADSAYIPAVRKETFPTTVYTEQTYEVAKRHFLPERICERVQLQNYIAKKGTLGNWLESWHENVQHVGHFLVQSCRHKGSGANDYTRQFNVADPLVWLLTELKLFPLDVMEE